MVSDNQCSKGKSAVDERRIIARLGERDEKAFTQLVNLHKGWHVYSLLSHVKNNHGSRRYCTDTFVRAFLAIHSFRGDSQLSTWLYRIAVNLCKNRLKYNTRRKQGRHGSIDSSEAYRRRVEGRIDAWRQGPMGERTPQPDEVLDGHRAQSNIARALSDVDPEFRTLLVLRDLQGLPYDEIQAITHLPIGTVKSRLHRARAALKRAYDALGDEVN